MKFIFSVKSPVFRCKICKGFHGNIHGDNICPDCRSKGYR